MKVHTMNYIRPICLSALLASIGLTARAAGGPRLPSDLRTETRRAIGKGLDYLVAAQNPEGAWQAYGRPHPAITAMVTKCLIQEERFGPRHATSKRGLAYVLKHRQDDGGIYVEGEGMRNYHTSVALMTLAAMDDPALGDAIKGAQTFLRKIQWDEGEDHDPSSTWYGGQGYGKHKRPDLSNTQLMLEALHQSGLPANDPAYKKAMAFITRCQMLSETNDQPIARGSDDGGFIYTPAGGGESKAGTDIVDGKPRLRSYGSMTYAGFKSMLYAEVDRDDVRVQRAMEWIRRHYTLEHNPNMPLAQSKEGLYYYYHVFARALDAWGEERIVDARGKPHPWREELCKKLIALQQPDGSWTNEHDRWYEGNPHLVTAYAILAMQTALGE